MTLDSTNPLTTAIEPFGVSLHVFVDGASFLPLSGGTATVFQGGNWFVGQSGTWLVGQTSSPWGVTGTELVSIDSKSTRAFSSASNTRPTITTSSTSVLASNGSRKYVNIFNGSGAVIYLKLGATAVVNEGIRLANNELFEITSSKLWTGSINAIRGAGSGAIEVFEGT